MVEKFTPGPWRFEPPSWGFSQITGPNGELIFVIAAGSIDEKRSDAECEANARLIAAAPELYTALYDLIKDIETDGGVDTSEWPPLDAGRAALAKARGEPR